MSHAHDLSPQSTLLKRTARSDPWHAPGAGFLDSWHFLTIPRRPRTVYSGMNQTLRSLTLLAALCGPAIGQAQFDAASIKPNHLADKGGEGSRRQNVVANPGSLTM